MTLHQPLPRVAAAVKARVKVPVVASTIWPLSPVTIVSVVVIVRRVMELPPKGVPLKARTVEFIVALTVELPTAKVVEFMKALPVLKAALVKVVVLTAEVPLKARAVELSTALMVELPTWKVVAVCSALPPTTKALEFWTELTVELPTWKTVELTRAFPLHWDWTEECTELTVELPTAKVVELRLAFPERRIATELITTFTVELPTTWVPVRPRILVTRSQVKSESPPKEPPSLNWTQVLLPPGVTGEDPAWSPTVPWRKTTAPSVFRI